MLSVLLVSLTSVGKLSFTGIRYARPSSTLYLLTDVIGTSIWPHVLVSIDSAQLLILCSSYMPKSIFRSLSQPLHFGPKSKSTELIEGCVIQRYFRL